MSVFDRVLEFDTTIAISVSLPDGGHEQLTRVIDELRARGMPEGARVQATLQGADRAGLRVDVVYDALSDDTRL